MYRSDLKPLFITLVLTAIGCVDNGKIDKTNAILEANQDQLKEINANMVKETSRLVDPFNAMVTLFENRDEDLRTFFLKGTKATEQFSNFLSSITPETIEQVADSFKSGAQGLADFNRALVEKEPAYMAMLQQLITSLTVLGRMGGALGLVSPED